MGIDIEIEVGMVGPLERLACVAAEVVAATQPAVAERCRAGRGSVAHASTS